MDKFTAIAFVAALTFMAGTAAIIHALQTDKTICQTSGGKWYFDVWNGAMCERGARR
jgi:hypothetical protein